MFSLDRKSAPHAAPAAAPKKSATKAPSANPLWFRLATSRPTVSSPADAHEREADRTAESVMREAEPLPAGTAPSGAPIPAETRAHLEPRFGVDLGAVRIHHGEAATESASALGARAYTFGSDVVFGAGQYQPGSPGGARVLVHELAHVAQQGAPSLGARAGAAPQRTTRAPANTVHRVGDKDKELVPPVKPPAPQMPTRVSGTNDEEQAQEDMARFHAGAPYFLHDYRPSTGRGFFSAMYHPPSLHITVKVRFGFQDTVKEDWPNATDADVTWTEAQKADYKQRFMTDVSAKWTQESFRVFCTKKGWESLSANVVVKFVDVDTFFPAGLGLTKADVKAHWDLAIRKVPPGRQLQSVTIPPGGTRPNEGMADLDSSGLTPLPNKSGNKQRAAVHESGHMLGLGDTYAKAGTVVHGKLAEKETGETIRLADDGRLMSRGESLGRTDAVVFVEVMRKVTNMSEWSLNPRFPRPAIHPDDGVPPRETIG